MSSEEIFGAIAAGEMERVRDLVAQDASCAGARNEQGISALMWALYNRRSDMADVVLEVASGVDVFEAAALGRTETLSELIAEDATLIGGLSPDGFTALHLAAFFGHAEAVTLLLQQGAEASVAAKNPSMVHPLHSAAASGSTETVQALLQGGADVNAAQHGGWTALQAAAKQNNVEMARRLLAAGADVARRVDDGQGALDLAEAEGHDEMVALLKAV